MADTVELTRLTRDDCVRLIADAVIGRVVFTHAALPAADPVTYLLDGEDVVSLADAGPVLAAATSNDVVAFQVDDIDTDTRTGWSVIGIGEMHEILDPLRLSELADRQPPPWAPDQTAHTLCIPLQVLTGRQVTHPATTPEPTPTRVPGVNSPTPADNATSPT